MCRDGGRNPVWDENFDFQIINDNTLNLTLMDEDTLTRDDLIGTSTISLARVREQGRDVVQAPVSVGRKIQKQQGFVQVTLTFIPISTLRPGGQPVVQSMGPPPAMPGYYYPAPATGYTCSHPPAAVYPPSYGYSQSLAPAYGPSPPAYHPPPPSYSYGPPPAQPQPTQGWLSSAQPVYGIPVQPPSFYPPPAAIPAYGNVAYSAAPPKCP